MTGDGGMRKKADAEYPAATMAVYGPDDRRATKMVVAIVGSAKAEPGPMRKWVSWLTDVRADKKVAQELKEFLKEHRVKRDIAVERIIGCPHEEGLDYPEGMKCPLCPFWSNRNRFTHEPEA